MFWLLTDWFSSVPGAFGVSASRSLSGRTIAKNSIYIYDVTHFHGCPKHAVFAVMDLVTRKWICELVSIEETSTQVQVVFLDALASEGLLELATVRHDYNTVRLHAGIGYVTADDEHEGRGPRIRAARKRGLRHARWDRIIYHRIQQSKAKRRSPADAA